MVYLVKNYPLPYMPVAVEAPNNGILLLHSLILLSKSREVMELVFTSLDN